MLRRRGARVRSLPAERVQSPLMLLTCSVRSIADLLHPADGSPPRLGLADVPEYVRDELGLSGLAMSTDLLAGATREDLTKFRDSADKARCACLLLFEPEPMPLATADEEEAGRLLDRVARVTQAAHLLGCNAAGIAIDAPDEDEAFETVVARIRRSMDRADHLELNLLLTPTPGLTEQPDRMSEMLKKIGGFRIGTLPTFGAAARADDPVHHLKRITPYASAVLATTIEFGEAPEGEADEDRPGSLEELTEMLMSSEQPPAPHTAYDLEPLVGAVASVGFDGTLAIDYRGEEDGTTGVLKSREALEAALQSVAEG